MGLFSSVGQPSRSTTWPVKSVTLGGMGGGNLGQPWSDWLLSISPFLDLGLCLSRDLLYFGPTALSVEAKGSVNLGFETYKTQSLDARFVFRDRLLAWSSNCIMEQQQLRTAQDQPKRTSLQRLLFIPFAQILVELELNLFRPGLLATDSYSLHDDCHGTDAFVYRKRL